MAKDAIESFNKHNLHYWVDYGTLLGIVRNNDIIMFDNDVDFSVLDNKDTHEKIKKIEKHLGKKYKIKKEKWDAYRIYKNKLHVDIFIFKKDKYKDTYLGPEGESSNIPTKHIGECRYIKWEKMNINVKAPENIHDTLVYRYGIDYMTPRYW